MCTAASRSLRQGAKEKLDELGKRRGQIEESLAAIEIGIGEIERDMVDRGLVMQALADFSEVFREIKPYRQKELMRLVLHKAILGPDKLKLGLSMDGRLRWGNFTREIHAFRHLSGSPGCHPKAQSCGTCLPSGSSESQEAG